MSQADGIFLLVSPWPRWLHCHTGQEWQDCPDLSGSIVKRIRPGALIPPTHPLRALHWYWPGVSSWRVGKPHLAWDNPQRGSATGILANLPP